MSNVLDDIRDSYLCGYNRPYLEELLSKFSTAAKNHLRDLLLSCCYYINEVNGDYIDLEEVVLYDDNAAKCIRIWAFDGDQDTTFDVFKKWRV